ncbi:hypothetical protein [Amycolatopsis taiwanensis]|uniref:hypothetical protein n=1 Tax=Amycolatopsis taiwanensis TaxID=342230 RepID=UPI0004BBED60|nr:hypothetical protein [Amycolatopsis taiwanensis]
MGTVLPPFPDAEDVVMALLEQVAPTVSDTPPDLTPPLIKVNRVGGSDDGITDYPRVEVSCYGHDHAEARRLGEQCRQVILGSVRTVAAGALIDSVRTDNPPTRVPYATSDDERCDRAYYRLAWRRTRVGTEKS